MGRVMLPGSNYKKVNTQRMVIEAEGIHKKYRVYYDKGSSLKEKMLFRKRNRYEERWVLKGVDLQVRKGEAVGLLGVNGCGKSTFLKLLSRIMYPDKGEIKISGRVSCLIELGAGFHPDLSGRENIYTNAAIFGLTKKEIDARLNDIIEFSELGDYIDNPVRTYSSGMYMRLAFSVAINVDADILLIDEILAVGDANFQEKCLNKLRQLKKDGMTIVIVSHDLYTIETFCDKGVWISDGVVASSGEITSVIGDYRAFLDAQKQEKEEAAQAAASEQETPAEEAPEEESSEEKEPAEAEIDTTQDHFGTGTAVITKAVFRDKDGKETQALAYGQPFSIDIHYKVNEPGHECIFGIAFHCLNRELIYGTNQRIDGTPTDLPSDEGIVTFEVDNNGLMAGSYIFSVAIIDENEVPLDFYRKYCEFEVLSDKLGIGIVNFDHAWKIRGGAESKKETDA